MSTIKNWVKTKLIQAKKWIKRLYMKITRSWTFALIVGLTIGITGHFTFTEGIKVYNEVTSIHIVGSVAKAETTDPVLQDNSVGGIKEEDKNSSTLADIIYKKESTNGKFDQKCERIGGHNGYGFGQGNGRNFCLESDEAVRTKVVEWIEDKISKGYSDNEILCYYNTGIKINNCDYIK